MSCAKAPSSKQKDGNCSIMEHSWHPMSDKHREGFGSIHDKNNSQIFLPCSLEGVIFVLSFPPLQFSQSCVEGRVVEASTSVLGPFANIYFAPCQLACVMAARVRPVPWTPCYYFPPLEIRQKDITLNTQNQKLTVLLGTP